VTAIIVTPQCRRHGMSPKRGGVF